MPDVSGGPVVANSCVYLHFTREAMGALGARHSPRPLLGRRDIQNSGDSRRENAELYLNVIARRVRCFSTPLSSSAKAVKPGDDSRVYRGHLSSQGLLATTVVGIAQRPQLSSPGLTGRSSIPEASGIEPRSCGVLDPPLSRGTTTCCWAAFVRTTLR
jgi:hypothetical protein